MDPALIEMVSAEVTEGTPLSLHMEYIDHRDPEKQRECMEAIARDRRALRDLAGVWIACKKRSTPRHAVLDPAPDGLVACEERRARPLYVSRAGCMAGTSWLAVSFGDGAFSASCQRSCTRGLQASPSARSIARSILEIRSSAGVRSVIRDLSPPLNRSVGLASEPIAKLFD